MQVVFDHDGKKLYLLLLMLPFDVHFLIRLVNPFSYPDFYSVVLLNLVVEVLRLLIQGNLNSEGN